MDPDCTHRQHFWYELLSDALRLHRLRSCADRLELLPVPAARLYLLVLNHPSGPVGSGLRLGFAQMHRKPF
jgi:hypothetical protein